MRVLETVIRPGEQTQLHTHVWSAHLYVLSWSDFERLGADGSVIFRSSEFEVTPGPGTALWTGPLPLHAFRNVGSRNVHVITTEVKS